MLHCKRGGWCCREAVSPVGVVTVIYTLHKLGYMQEETTVMPRCGMDTDSKLAVRSQ